MSTYLVHLGQIEPLMVMWAERYKVHIPVEVERSIYDFVPWRKGEEIAWEYDITYNSPKRFFLPPRETLITFDVDNCQAEAVYSHVPQLIFGVHPYDLKAINQIDKLMGGTIPDRHYGARRAATVIFSMEPCRVAKNAFWPSVDAHKVDSGFDLHWTRISPAAFCVQVGTELGEQLLLACGPLTKATAAEREAARRAQQRVLTEASREGLDFPWQETAKILHRAWDSPLWQHRARHCFSCGTCNLVCPTCFCFDMKEDLDNTLKKGERYRSWDGCMMDAFSRVAGDHNFRPHTLERYRHRYYRKGKYIYDMIGELGCVGCGRCVGGCTSGIADPKSVFNSLWEAEKHDA